MALEPTGCIGRAVQWVAGSPMFATVAPTIVPPIDRALSRATGGKVVLSAGARAEHGARHRPARRPGPSAEAPLATMPDGDGFYVVGSNFGREAHPAWTANLLANPEPLVVFRGEAHPPSWPTSSTPTRRPRCGPSSWRCGPPTTATSTASAATSASSASTHA